MAVYLVERARVPEGPPHGKGKGGLSRAKAAGAHKATGGVSPDEWD